MYSCIKKVTFSRTGFPDLIIREMKDDISNTITFEMRGGKSNHVQSGYSWHIIQNEALDTYRRWMVSLPENTTVKIENF